MLFIHRPTGENNIPRNYSIFYLQHLQCNWKKVYKYIYRDMCVWEGSTIIIGQFALFSKKRTPSFLDCWPSDTRGERINIVLYRYGTEGSKSEKKRGERPICEGSIQSEQSDAVATILRCRSNWFPSREWHRHSDKYVASKAGCVFFSLSLLSSFSPALSPKSRARSDV